VNRLKFNGAEARVGMQLGPRRKLLVIPKPMLLLNLTGYHDPWLAAKRDNFFKKIAAIQRHRQEIGRCAAVDFREIVFMS
jgi:hypothetical protein